MSEKYTKQYINGKWVEGKSEKTVDNYNPYTGQLINSIQSANPEDLDEAFSAAAKAQVKWQNTMPAEKQQHFKNLIDVMEKRKEEIIDWLIKEAGSTKLKAKVELEIAMSVIQESTSFPTRMPGKIFPSNIPGKENRVYRLPKGVIGVIGPWNFPIQLSMRSIAPALATGNAVVVKPSSDTPVTAGLLLADLFDEAGFPPGLLNVIVGRGSEIGDDFLTHPVPSVISFTGSTEVGRHIGELAGKNLKEVSLELGGNNAMIVLEDADIEKAVEAAVFGNYLHQGQICMAVNRVIVLENIYEEFASAMEQKVKTLQAGDPNDENTIIGPVINEGQRDSILKDVEESVEQGAKKLVEGEVDSNLIHPILLRDVTNEMPIAKNEIFGPVATLLKAGNEEEAIKIANNSPNGLSGSIFTRDLQHGVDVAMQIETGMIHINDQPVNDEPHVVFGGEKASGVGRFNGEWVIDKFTTDKWISVQHEYRQFPF